MAEITARELLEAGAHFGHQTKRWNPKMRRYIFGRRNGIHIIDLRKTQVRLAAAIAFVHEVARKGGKVLFVGTKKQAQDAVTGEAQRCGMYYVTERWLGGFLTNYTTIRVSVDKMKRLEKMDEDRSFGTLTKKERLMREREYTKLSKVLCGVKAMAELPTAVFLVDTRKESIAIKECRKLGIPVVAMVDTNSDPTEIDFPVPANDDAVRSIRLVTKAIADAVIEGRHEAGDFNFGPDGDAVVGAGGSMEAAIAADEAAVAPAAAESAASETTEAAPVEEAAVVVAQADKEPVAVEVESVPAAAEESAKVEENTADSAEESA
jgi:small subunit ribosomal protein S2